jgi:hypothetical protein
VGAFPNAPPAYRIVDGVDPGGLSLSAPGREINDCVWGGRESGG